MGSNLKNSGFESSSFVTVPNEEQSEECRFRIVASRPKLCSRDKARGGLVSIQQLTGQAAPAINDRFVTIFDHSRFPTPAAVLARIRASRGPTLAPEDSLSGCGKGLFLTELQ